LGIAFGNCIWELPLRIAFGNCLWELTLGIAFGNCLWEFPLGIAFGNCLWELPLGIAFGNCLGASRNDYLHNRKNVYKWLRIAPLMQICWSLILREALQLSIANKKVWNLRKSPSNLSNCTLKSWPHCSPLKNANENEGCSSRISPMAA